MAHWLAWIYAPAVVTMFIPFVVIMYGAYA